MLLVVHLAVMLFVHLVMRVAAMMPLVVLGMMIAMMPLPVFLVVNLLVGLVLCRSGGCRGRGG